MITTGLIHDLGKIIAVKDAKMGIPGEPQWVGVTCVVMVSRATSFNAPGSELSMQSPAQAVVGDTFPVGLPFSDKNVFAEYFKLNPDSANPLYNSGTGVYKAGCGLQHVHMSWGRCSWLSHN